MKVKLTSDQMREISDENDLIVNGETWEYVGKDGDDEEDENGRYEYCIYKRLSDNKHFRITVFYCRYGYEDYGFESDIQDATAYEVEKKEIVETRWVGVK